MRRHFSAETLALYDEGALRGRKLARVGSHLSRCDQCARVMSDLAAVSNLLSGTPAPPMPEHLADRVMAALASESAARASSPALAAGDQAGMKAAAGRAGAAGESAFIPGRPDLPARSGRSGGAGRAGAGRRWLAPLSSPLVLRSLAAAGAVVIIAGTGFLLANGQQSAAPRSGTASGASKSASGPAAAAPKPTAMTTNRPASVAAAPAKVSYRLDGKQVTAPAVATDVNYTHRTLDAQVNKRISAIGAGQMSTATPTGPVTRLPGIRLPTLGKCLTRIDAGRRVLLADVARFLGKPAVIIVLKSLTTFDVLDVSVVSKACSAANPHVIATAEVPAG